MSKALSRLVVIPSDPIAAYELKGIDSWLEGYYNPQRMFHEVFAVSPLEKGERKAYGMTIIGVGEQDFVKVLHDIQPDLIRAYGGYWPADLACRYRLPGVPVIVSVHDPNPSLLYLAVRYADLVICVSGAVEKRVLAKGVALERIRRLPNRIDTKVFRPVRDKDTIRSIVGSFGKGKHILCVGRRSKEKNQDTLIRALKLLGTDFSCVFLGRGDLSPYARIAEELGVSERCFWLDSVRNDELPSWYSWCDCMCIPSRWEGFGVVFIEAAACGAAIVTSDIEPMNEYLSHKVSAHLVKDYEDPSALAEAIRQVCEDAEYRSTLSAGAVKAAQPYDREIIDAMEVAIYREAMNLAPLPWTIRLERAIWRVRKTIDSNWAHRRKSFIGKAKRWIFRL